MKYIISGTNIKQVDKYSIEKIGIPSLVLMERAALAVAEQVEKVVNADSRVIVFANVGNNGGDGVAVARILLNRGLSTCLYVIGNAEKATTDFKTQLEIYKRVNGLVTYINLNSEFSINEFSKDDVIIDALFGVGLARDISGIYKNVVECINNTKSIKIAVDVPSGINADTGAVMGCAVDADYTVTFNANRTGLVLYPGCEYAGNVIIRDIGFPKEALESVDNAYCLEPEDIIMLPERVANSNKGTYGKILIIAGSDTMTGAAYMSSLAAMRMGAGMVKVFTTEKCAAIIQTSFPEAMVETWNSSENYTNRLKNSLDWCDVIVIGPGLGQTHETKELLKCALKSAKKIVVDADGINLISASDEIKKLLHKQVVITPHIGEMSRLTGISIPEIKNNLVYTARKCAGELGITVVLKDARSVITDGTNTYINITGNNGMATAGSGDVLAGITGAIWATSKMSKFLGDDVARIAALAHMIHGMAGDMAANKYSKAGLMATDIISELKTILEKAEAK